MPTLQKKTNARGGYWGKLASPGDVRRMLRWCIMQVKADKMETAKANCLGQLALFTLKAMEAEVLHDRLINIERQLDGWTPPQKIMRLSSNTLRRIEKLIAEREQPKILTAKDPLAFSRQLGLEPDPWQQRVLTSLSKRLLLNCCRQSGKSTTTAILSLYHALSSPQSLILLVSPSQRQSSELFRKVTDFLVQLPVRPRLLEDNKLSLQLRNGSRIVSLPSNESTIRGFSGVSMIIEDEAARVDDAIFFACRPMLATSAGRHILMSTPWGQRGHFYEMWEHGGEEWERVRVPATECPRIPSDFLAEEARAMPQRWFDSEYNCLFTDVDGAVFRHADLLLALSSAIEPLNLGGLTG